jgi:hypothetical protein
MKDIKDDIATESLIKCLESLLPNKENYEIGYTSLRELPGEGIDEVYYIYLSHPKTVFLKISYYSCYEYGRHLCFMHAEIPEKKCFINVMHEYDRLRILKLLNPCETVAANGALISEITDYLCSCSNKSKG